MHRSLIALSVVATLSLALAACSSSESGTSSGGATSGGETTSTSGTGGAGGGATSTTGAGGMGTGGSGTGTTTGTGGMGTGGAGTGGSGSGTAGDHLLISEIGANPAGNEFIEITNPTASAVDLSDYYLSDNATYYTIAQGKPWSPITNNPGTDFLAQFPQGTTIPAGGVLVIGSKGYETLYQSCPDFVLDTAPLACGNGTVPAMVAPPNGEIGNKQGALLSNDREMLVLFRWDGDTNHPLQDVDYVTWGATFDAGTRADKTAVPGYQPDTAPASQKPAAAPPQLGSIERCAVEPGEKLSGGNGITGHDETSEDLGTAFKTQATPTPGKANGCQ